MTIWKTIRLLSVAAPIVLGGCTNVLSGLEIGAGSQQAAGTYFERGKFHYAAGQYGLAVKQFQFAVNRESDSVEALNGLAATYDRLGRYDLAARYYGRALALDPDSVQTLNNIGYSYLLQKRLDLAVAYLRDAHARDRDNAVVTANREVAEVALQETDLRRSAASVAKVEEVVQVPLAAPGTKQVAPWIERTAPAVQTLVTEPQFALVGMARDAGISPRLAAYRPDERGVEEDPLPEPIAAPIAIRLPGRLAVVATADAGTADDALGERAPKVDARLALLGSGEAPVIEVSNGTGRLRMAARMRGYMEAEGILVARLTNADNFRHMETTIFYREGWKDYASGLARLFPSGVDLVGSDGQTADIRVELGGDLLNFDRELYYAGWKSSTARSS